MGEPEVAVESGGAAASLRGLYQRARKTLIERRAQQILREYAPRDDWHSWEPAPAEHPWLTADNLRAMRAFSEHVWARARRAAAGADVDHLRFACVGNLANNLYQRAEPLRRRGLAIEMVLHPHDRFVMSQPGWEEWDGELLTDERDVDTLALAGVRLAEVRDVVSLPTLEQQLAIGQDGRAAELGEVLDACLRDRFLRIADVLRFPVCLAYLSTLRHLQGSDALLTTQAPYLAYLARRPYLAAPSGGDLWLDCSRGDHHGILQRLGFGQANALLATNPWTFGHARRFGFTNAIYLPFMLDDEVFSPGPGHARAEWVERTGGSFFVLQTARVDERYKASSVALEGFAEFSRRCPGARLVLLGWGVDLDSQLRRYLPGEIRDRVLLLPLAGKRRIIDYLRAADVLVDQFGLGAYGATALEAMGCGLPVVMRIERDQYDALVPAGAPPICDASNPREVADQLERLATNPDARGQAREAARRWFLAAHGSSAWSDTYIDLLVATACGTRFRYRSSPLARALTATERDYHAANLAGAPPYLVWDVPADDRSRAGRGSTTDRQLVP